jgi:hypothetical protein
MDFECDETVQIMKKQRLENMDLNGEREEEIYMEGFICAMDYFRDLLEKL